MRTNVLHVHGLDSIRINTQLEILRRKHKTHVKLLTRFSLPISGPLNFHACSAARRSAEGGRRRHDGGGRALPLGGPRIIHYVYYDLLLCIIIVIVHILCVIILTACSSSGRSELVCS